MCFLLLFTGCWVFSCCFCLWIVLGFFVVFRGCWVFCWDFVVVCCCCFSWGGEGLFVFWLRLAACLTDFVSNSKVVRHCRLVVSVRLSGCCSGWAAYFLRI